MFKAINRTLLKWLKLWDKTVFGKGQEKKSKPKSEQSKMQKSNQAKNIKKQGKGVQDEADWSVRTKLLFILTDLLRTSCIERHLTYKHKKYPVLLTPHIKKNSAKTVVV